MEEQTRPFAGRIAPRLLDFVLSRVHLRERGAECGGHGALPARWAALAALGSGSPSMLDSVLDVLLIQ